MAGSLADDDFGRAQTKAGMGRAGNDGDVGVDGTFGMSFHEIRLQEDLFPFEREPVGCHDGRDLLFHIPAVIGHGEQRHRAGGRGQLRSGCQSSESRGVRQDDGGFQEFAPLHEVNTFFPERAIRPREKFPVWRSSSAIDPMTF